MSMDINNSIVVFASHSAARDLQLSHYDYFDVLVVEDCGADRVMLKEVFSKYGPRFRLHIVCDGSEAISFCQNKGSYLTSPRPDLALLDVNLPGINGFEVLEEMRLLP